jgi:hypothetical protein
MTTSTVTANPEKPAIEALILECCKVLGLSRVDLVRRAGFKNVAKGLRHLSQATRLSISSAGRDVQAVAWSLGLMEASIPLTSAAGLGGLNK